ncbi:MAG TPA: RDD family protein [Roseiflexaceae bacterium]|nr:RDD family protein [Roseiflexaceae bacterium]HMP39004.1 RDD family protein [Roseiflexaceae bacterium]
MSDRYTVDTPENIELFYEIGGIGSRLLAALVDSLLIGILLVFVSYLTGMISDALAVFESVVLAIGAIVSFLIFWGYYLLFEMLWSGQSPGKRLIGLRTVREGGHPITFSGSAIRNFIRIIDFLPFLYGVGVVVMFIDTRARRLGDLAGGTLVVKERRGVTLEQLLAGIRRLPSRAADAPQIATIELLDDNDYLLISDFLARRREFDPALRRELAARIADELQRRLAIAPGNPEALIEYVAAAYLANRRAASDTLSGDAAPQV